MIKSDIEKLLNEKKDPTKMLQIYFSDEAACHNINVIAESVDKMKIENGFLKVHDKIDKCWHCYNINCVIHFHYPDKAVKSNDKSKY